MVWRHHYRQSVESGKLATIRELVVAHGLVEVAHRVHGLHSGAQLGASYDESY